ncbi:hypothetical protein N7E81_08075 [Reichenbachiella carrageenanivorans]|uniref:Uncharacterized protein n=1 Tax=Reichenbachiella carrageenanivorans TaxID=2979869 RepID=A0ABY6D4H4_9BACT|nr:hypothetical protein [Reichenbachiella carrageenanivorans]UXX81055.1 hypothetical protein N7E81_08075 [Reichenbachiella carrageenanivorans]
MQEEKNIERINQVISDYFEHSKKDTVAVRELMPDFIKAGIFTKDHKKGLPIRKILRALDEQNALSKIPFVHAERQEKHTFWYFVRTGATYVSDTPNDTGVSKKQKLKASRASSDEHYVINLCDEILEAQASRQHKFGFLLGDYHKNGKTRTPLPVDAYYKEQNLVIEFKERQHSEAIDTFDKPDKITVSGVTRSEQRKIYSERRKKGLKANDIQWLEIDYSDFECDSQKKLIRDKKKDLEVLNKLLKNYK